MTSLLTHPQRMDRLFNQLWQSDFGKVRSDHGEATVRPAVDILEAEGHYVIEADLPGVAKDDLQVEFEKGRLTLTARRHREESDDLQGLHTERMATASFARSFTLGKDIDAEKIEARLRDGVLRLTVPKKEQALPRRIHVE